ncbi:MAG: hypothetical protein JWP37_1339 [Mucilaginibacter sp.]|nr:hypothetical protein [Mucilaginibacter sp.]
MIKRYLFAILLLFVCAGSYAQSLSFEDLLNMTNMTGTQVHDFLTTSKGFKPAGTQMVNGRSMDQYKSTGGGTPDKIETVLVGAIVKSMAGSTSRPVSYLTLQESDINALLAQAKKSTLTLVFQGSDQKTYIYRFDNSLFRASISLSFDKKYGSIDVQQKE